MIRFEHTYANKDQVVVTLSNDDATMFDVMECFKKFCMAIGYAESSFIEACDEFVFEEKPEEIECQP